MIAQPNNYERAQSTVAHAYLGDGFPAVAAYVERFGIEPFKFVLSAAADQTVTREEVAAQWLATLDEPVDFALIDVVLGARRDFERIRVRRFQVTFALAAVHLARQHAAIGA